MKTFHVIQMSTEINNRTSSTKSVPNRMEPFYKIQHIKNTKLGCLYQKENKFQNNNYRIFLHQIREGVNITSIKKCC